MWSRGLVGWCVLALGLSCAGNSVDEHTGPSGGSAGTLGVAGGASGRGNVARGGMPSVVESGGQAGGSEDGGAGAGEAGDGALGGRAGGGATSGSGSGDRGGAAGKAAGGAAGAPSIDEKCTRGTLAGDGVWNADNSDLETLRGYTELEGSLGLGSNVTDLSALHCLESIGGSLSLSYASKLTTLHGLENLTLVGGALTTGECDPEDGDCWSAEALADLRALSRLTEVGRSLDLRGLSALRSLAGLEQLTRVGDALFLLDLEITDVDGLRSLANVRAMYIGGNSALVSLEGFANLTKLSERLYIHDNAVLTNLEGLHHLRGVGELLLQSNPLRTLEGLRGLEAVNGTVQLDGLPELTDLSGLEHLAHIEGDLLIGACSANSSSVDGSRYYERSACTTHNDELENVDGLSGLSSLDGDLLVANNDELTSLAGLRNIDSVDSIHHRRVVVIDNAKLPDFHGLDGWARGIDTLVIADNDALTNVEALSNLHVDRDLWVLRNHSLTKLDGFPASWSTVTGMLSIRENPALTYVHVLDGVNTLFSIQLEENESLVQFEGPQNLLEIGTLSIEGTSLSDLTHLSTLASASYLQLTGNPLLTSLRGLSQLTSVSHWLRITGNESLPDCEVAWLCALVPNAMCVSADNGGDIGTCDP